MIKDIEKTKHYTSNYKLICSNLLKYIPKDAQLIEPFVGSGELLKLLPDRQWECYDLEPTIQCIKRDTLLDPVDYEGKYIITNPPYLAKNKASDKTLFNKYQLDDLYKIALHTMLKADGGIIIIPMNFFTDENSGKIREEFLNVFDIKEVNVFTQPIFDSTTYSVCSFYFEKKTIFNDKQDIQFNICPEDKHITISLYHKYKYRLGGEVFDLPKENIFGRLLKGIEPQYKTNIFLSAIDKRDSFLGLSYNVIEYYGKNTDRVYATLTCSKELSIQKQKTLIDNFNKQINEYRKIYANLLFTNYRDYNRKRVEFDFVYRYLTKLYYEMEH